MSILWRAAALAAVPNNPDYFNEQQQILNQTIGLYLDELSPERKVERKQAIEDSTEKMKKFVKKKPAFNLITNSIEGRIPKPGKPISVLKRNKKKHGR